MESLESILKAQNSPFDFPPHLSLRSQSIRSQSIHRWELTSPSLPALKEAAGGVGMAPCILLNRNPKAQRSEGPAKEVRAENRDQGLTP